MSLKQLKNRNTFFILLFFPITALLLSKKNIDKNALMQYGNLNNPHQQTRPFYQLFKKNNFGFGYLNNNSAFIILEKKKYSTEKKITPSKVKVAFLTDFTPTKTIEIETKTKLKNILKIIKTQMDTATIFAIKISGEFEDIEQKISSGHIIGYWIPESFSHTTPTNFQLFLLNSKNNTFQKITTATILKATLELENKNKLTFNLL